MKLVPIKKFFPCGTQVLKYGFQNQLRTLNRHPPPPTVDYFEKVCAISKVVMVLIRENIY